DVAEVRDRNAGTGNRAPYSQISCSLHREISGSRHWIPDQETHVGGTDDRLLDEDIGLRGSCHVAKKQQSQTENSLASQPPTCARCEKVSASCPVLHD